MGKCADNYQLEDCLCKCGGYRPHNVSLNTLAEIDQIVGRILTDSAYGKLTLSIDAGKAHGLIYEISRRL